MGYNNLYFTFIDEEKYILNLIINFTNYNKVKL